MPVQLPALQEIEASSTSSQHAGRRVNSPLKADAVEMEECPRILRLNSSGCVEQTRSMTTFICDEFQRIERIDLVVSNITSGAANN